MTTDILQICYLYIYYRGKCTCTKIMKILYIKLIQCHQYITYLKFFHILIMLCKVIYYAAYKIIYKIVFIILYNCIFILRNMIFFYRYNIRPLNGVYQWRNITVRLCSSSSDSSSSDSSSSESDSDSEKTKSPKYAKNSAASNNKDNLGSFLNNMIQVNYNFQLF